MMVVVVRRSEHYLVYGRPRSVGSERVGEGGLVDFHTSVIESTASESESRNRSSKMEFLDQEYR